MRINPTIVALLVLCLALPSLLLAAAPFKLNNALSSNMVLQRGPQSSQLWGTGEPGQPVSAQLDGAPVAKATVDSAGRWLLQLPPHTASLNHTITASDGTTTVTLVNVAFGDVYLCSGQSNMQVTLNFSWGGDEAIAMAHMYPNLRLLNKPTQNNTVPLNESIVSYSPDSWVLPSRSTLQDVRNIRDVFSYFSAACYWTGMHLYNSLNGSVPIGLVQSSFGGTVVAAWTSNETVLSCGPVIPPRGTENNAQNQPTVLYNAMIHPFLPMKFTAALWYQGENDSYDPQRYACSFPNMVRDWRAKFGRELPFYFVLLAPYAGSSFIALRQAQLQALRLPRTGVANTLDLGDMASPLGDIHPRNKSYVGERLARWLRRDLYGQQVVVAGPQALNASAGMGGGAGVVTVVVVYERGETSEGLFAMSTPNCTVSFCCEMQADGSVVGLIDLHTSSKQVLHPAVYIDAAGRRLTINVSTASLAPDATLIGVSFGWLAYPGCLLYNRYGLPALPSYHNVTITTTTNTPPTAPAAAATLQVNSLFSSNMVLQRAPVLAALWGTGEPGRTVAAAVDGVGVAKEAVDGDGRWMVRLPAYRASVNRTVTLSDGTSTVTLGKVAFGDVYLCSGQSNMEVVLNFSWGGPEAIATSHRYPNIRLLNIPTQHDTVPRNDTNMSYSPNSWVLPSAATLQAPNPKDDMTYFSAVCFYTGRDIHDALNGSVPIGLVQSSFGGTVVAAWTSNDTVTRCGAVIPPIGYENNAQNQPAVLYNAMIHPLLQMRFTAVLWYQGENDYYDPDRYACSFPNMVQDWREKFAQRANLPFYFVLLAPQQNSSYIAVRHSQLAALRLPRTGVANTLDLGDMASPLGPGHPRNKSYIGERLARWVRRDVYGQRVVVEGPRVVAVRSRQYGKEAVEVMVEYERGETSDGLYAMSTPNCTAVSFCCTTQRDGGVVGLIDLHTSQGVMHPAVYLNSTAGRLTANISMSSLPAGDTVLGVSFGWLAYPGCLLYNRYGLPALPSYANLTIASVPVRGARPQLSSE